jgi:hypothetical protein
MRRLLVALSYLACQNVLATDHRVGPTRPFQTLQALLDARNIEPGDVIHVDGNHTYAVGSGVVVRSDDGGSTTLPVTIRGERIEGRRPVLQGGTNTIKFQSSNHVVLEGIDITGGTSRCVFHDAHDVTLRDVRVHDCPNHGVHSADLAGSLTIEYSELHHIGSAGNDQKHTIYAQTGEMENPGAFFRLRYSYVHDGLSGNLVKSRAERTELHYNWIEAARVQEVEMLSPDPDFQENPAWSDATAREDGELVGNVIVHAGPASAYAVRLGGDGTGAGSSGRYRLLNNTFVFRAAGTALRLFSRLQSVDAHNNVFTRLNGGGLQIFRDVEAQWVDAQGMTTSRQLSGSNNFVDSSAGAVPSAWTSTRMAATAGFENAADNNFVPGLASELTDAGNGVAAPPPLLPFPAPMEIPRWHARRSATAPGQAAPRPSVAAIDMGAFERSSDHLFADGFQSP